MRVGCARWRALRHPAGSCLNAACVIACVSSCARWRALRHPVGSYLNVACVIACVSSCARWRALRHPAGVAHRLAPGAAAAGRKPGERAGKAHAPCKGATFAAGMSGALPRAQICFLFPSPGFLAPLRGLRHPGLTYVSPLTGRFPGGRSFSRCCFCLRATRYGRTSAGAGGLGLAFRSATHG